MSRHRILRSSALAALVLVAGGLLANIGRGQDAAALPVTVIAAMPGASPAEMEQMVVVPLEAALNGLAKLRKISARCESDRALVWVWFDRGVAVARARQLVAARLKRGLLPETATLSLAPVQSGRAILLGLSAGSLPKETGKRLALAGALRDAAEFTLRPRLLTIAGVSQVTVAGGLRKEYQVVVSPKRLKAFNVTIAELAAAIEKAGVDVDRKPPKGVEEFLIRGLGKFRTTEDIARVVVKTSNGRIISVKDLADVRTGWKTDDGRIANKPPDTAAVVLAVGLQPGADVGRVSKQIDEIRESLPANMPQGAKVQRSINASLKTAVLQVLSRDLPPEVRLERRATRPHGDVVEIATGGRITVTISGPDLALLSRLGAQARGRVAKVPGASAPRVLAAGEVPELHIRLDRQAAARFDVTAQQAAAVLSLCMGQHVVGQVHEGGRARDVVVKVNDFKDNLRDCLLRTPKGDLVPLAAVATIKLQASPSAILRENGHRQVIVICEFKGPKPAAAQAEVETSLAPIKGALPQGYVIRID